MRTSPLRAPLTLIASFAVVAAGLAAVVPTAGAATSTDQAEPAAGTSTTGSAASGSATSSSTTTYNYAEALQKSFLFYEAQQSGHLPSWNRVSWRGEATGNDGKAEGVDLSGGFYDAGDHVKFGFPMAFAMTSLAWGGVDFRDAYASSGQLQPLLNNVKYGMDYLINAHPSANTLYVQVGDGTTDHNYWGAPETLDARAKTTSFPRPAYKITASCPGTDVAAETGAAFAAASMLFKPTDASYAATLLTHAEQLFSFADSTKGTDGKDTAYITCVPAASGFYTSTQEGGQNEGATKMYWDELAWNAVWLYRATGNASYLAKAESFYPKMGSQTDAGGNGTKVPAYSYGFSWNDKEYGVYALLAKLTGQSQYKTDTQRYLDYWTVGYNGRKGEFTAGGLMFPFYWAPLRIAAYTALVALDYADYLTPSDALYSRYHDFAKRQIDYSLGDNPGKHSYVIGFGTNPPRNPHHRGSHGSWLNQSPTGPPTNNRHILYGALVGGPNSSDAWSDDRGDFIGNEVSLDYNAGFTSALARLTGEYGGTPVASIPKETPDGDEIYLDRSTLTSNSQGTSASIFLTNKSAWPARVLDKGTFRYYFTLDGSTAASQITVSSPYSLCQAPTGPALASGKTYYVTIDCTGTLSFPGGMQEYRREVQLSIRSSGTWDASNDWSARAAANMPLYDNGKLIWGTEPSASS